MTYTVEFSTSARKDYLSLPSAECDRVTSVIDRLESDPRPIGVRKMRGHDKAWRLRVGNYRILYEVDDAAKAIVVFRIRHRREVYRT